MLSRRLTRAGRALASLVASERPLAFLFEPYPDAPPERWEAHRAEYARLEAAGRNVVLIRPIGPPPPPPCDY